MSPLLARRMRVLAAALLAVGALLLVLRDPLLAVGWPARVPPAAVGSLALLFGLIALLAPGRRRPV